VVGDVSEADLAVTALQSALEHDSWLDIVIRPIGTTEQWFDTSCLIVLDHLMNHSHSFTQGEYQVCTGRPAEVWPLVPRLTERLRRTPRREGNMWLGLSAARSDHDPVTVKE
jgi:hypothetical protein